ncbi:hypothetical protein [Bacillus tuaregi]|uniref:hypothetical protein n=1 Tax=Bacillus tuaregi TaxID=1816695 RepID=UPI0008F7FA1B|nr:hypothetical protein [Bacillus tuaregi]
MMKQVQAVELSIKNQKNVVTGQVLRTVIYSRFKILEVKTPSLTTLYYCFFYNDLPVYGEALEQIEMGSFLAKAFHEGMVLEADHPLLPFILPSEKAVIPNKHKLFSQLQRQFSLQEVAYIATALDSFFSKEQLSETIDKLFFYFRRKGSFFKAYQILLLIHDFSPELSAAKDSVHVQDFLSYSRLYQSSSLQAIYKKDPLFIERHCFKNRMNEMEASFLNTLLSEQGRYVELLLLWIEKVQKLSKADLVDTYTTIALQFMTMEDWIGLLCYIHVNPFRTLPNLQAVMSRMVREDRYERAALFLLECIDDLPDSYDGILDLVWERAEVHFIAVHFKTFIPVMKRLIKQNKLKELEQKLFSLINLLLKTNDLVSVSRMLQPIQRLVPRSPLFLKINQMLQLLEDPDHMMELGQYYADFQQYDEAIECFSWEMELHPDAAAPVLQLSKMYQHKGMLEEASAYQQVYDQLVRNQVTG